MRNTLVLPGGLLVLGISLAPAAWGCCGLESCPRDPAPAPELSRVEIAGSIDVQQTSFDYLRIDGDYTEVMARAAFAAGRFRFVAVAPYVTLRFLDTTRSGAGNPVFTGEANVLQAGGGALALGLQYESPLGDSEHSLADDHTMFMPYVRADSRFRGVDLTASVGYRFSAFEPDAETAGDAAAAPPGRLDLARIQFHAGHAHGIPVLVNPHDDREILWRAEAASVRPFAGVVPAAHMAAEHVLGDASDASFYLVGGPALRVPLAGPVALETSASIPMGGGSRYHWRLDAALRLRGGFGE